MATKKKKVRKETIDRREYHRLHFQRKKLEDPEWYERRKEQNKIWHREHSDEMAGYMREYRAGDESIKHYHKHSSSSLTEDQVKEIRKMLRGGVTSAKIAEIYGVGRSTIYDIRNGVTWKHVK